MSISTTSHETTSADLFIPGRFSYPEQEPDGPFRLVASEASLVRAVVAADMTSTRDYNKVVFAGGYSGMMVETNPAWPRDPNNDSQPWVPDAGGHTREAGLMAQRFIGVTHLVGQLGGRKCPGVPLVQSESTNSIGDVRLSVAGKYLNSDDYADDPQREVHLVTGAAHGKRFIGTLALALDIPRGRIRRVGMKDVYGMPKTQFLPAESGKVAFLKEQAAGVIHGAVMRGVKPGDLDGLHAAEQDFTSITDNPKEVARVLRHMPAAVLDATLLTRRVHANTARSAGHVAAVLAR